MPVDQRVALGERQIRRDHLTHELGEGLSNRLPSQAPCSELSQWEPVLTMALSMVSSLRMQATRATLGSLPAVMSRW